MSAFKSRGARPNRSELAARLMNTALLRFDTLIDFYFRQTKYSEGMSVALFRTKRKQQQLTIGMCHTCWGYYFCSHALTY
jgi:hypothetical protein